MEFRFWTRGEWSHQIVSIEADILLVTTSILKEMKCDNDEDDTSFEAYFLDTLLFIKAFNKTLGQECNCLKDHSHRFM